MARSGGQATLVGEEEGVNASLDCSVAGGAAATGVEPNLGAALPGGITCASLPTASLYTGRLTVCKSQGRLWVEVHRRQHRHQRRSAAGTSSRLPASSPGWRRSWARFAPRRMHWSHGTGDPPFAHQYMRAPGYCLWSPEGL